MNNNSFNLPKNIKQIGTLDESLKVYIEDYAFTFMQQYSKENKNEDKIAVLVGEECNIDGNDTLFISGVIKPKYTIFENSMVKLTEKSFGYIQEQLEKYFSNLKIVGWVYSRPGFEKEISKNYIEYHKQTFFTEKKLLFLTDPIENVGSFFQFCNNEDNFKELKGFIIYYERNEAMSEYMLDNRSLNNLDLEKKKEKEEKIKKELSEENINLKKEDKKKEVKKAKNSISLENKKEIKKNNSEETKRYTNIFGSLTAVLILVCFVMAAGLIQNEDRISKLEGQLSKIDETYKYLLLQVKNDSVQSVFAETNSDLNKENNTTETPENKENNNSVTKEDSQSSVNKEVENEEEIVHYETTYDKLQQNKSNESNPTSVFKEEKVYKTYVIKDGDNLEKISREFYGSRDKINDIMELNAIDDPNKIYSGMSIKLP